MLRSTERRPRRRTAVDVGRDAGDPLGGSTASDDAPATFAVEILEAAQVPVRAGETVLVSATVENTGGTAGTQTVGLAVDADDVDTRAVSLEAGESTQVAFAWQTDEGENGDHTAAVSSADDSDTARAAVCEAGDVDYSGDVDSLDATLTQQHVAGSADQELYPDCADVDGDGEVASLDVTKILQKIVE